MQWTRAPHTCVVSYQYRLLVMLDEFPSLGKLEFLQELRGAMEQ